VGAIEIERLVEAGFGPIHVACRLVQHAHEEEDVGCGARAVVIGRADGDRLVEPSGVREIARLPERGIECGRIGGGISGGSRGGPGAGGVTGEAPAAGRENRGGRRGAGMVVGGRETGGAGEASAARSRAKTDVAAALSSVLSESAAPAAPSTSSPCAASSRSKVRSMVARAASSRSDEKVAAEHHVVGAGGFQLREAGVVEQVALDESHLIADAC